MSVHKVLKGLVVTLLLLFVCTSVQATIITAYATRAAFDVAFPDSVIENWDGFANGTTFADGTTANGITYNTSTSGASVVTNIFLTTTSPNGLGDTAVGFFAASDSVTFSFGNALSAFGIDINTFSTIQGDYLATLDIGDVIGSFFDPFPGSNTGQFIGFYSDTPFMSVTISSQGLDSYTLDTMRAVPEPTTLALLSFGFAGLFISRCKMKA